MLTAEAGRDTVLRIAKLGVRDYLIKPFKGDLLVERVGRVLALNSKSSPTEKKKRFDDAIRILVVDDKPAIAGQIRTALADTPWQVTSADQPGQALDCCMENRIDVVLASLTLPNDGAYMLFQNLRGFVNTASIPVLGLCVRTASVEQTRAQQAGFAGIVTKPIEADELKARISRSLGLQTLYKYFHQQNGALTLRFPTEVRADAAQEVSAHLDEQLAATVDAGGDKLIIDLDAVQTASLQVIELATTAMLASQKLSLRCAVVGPPALQNQCRVFEEAQSWVFAANFDEAVTLLK
jgi:two-component system cell cycle response regulator